MRRYLKGTAPAGEYLTDQLILPMAVARAGGFRSTGLSRHATTHVELIGLFLDHAYSDPVAGGRRGRSAIRLTCPGAAQAVRLKGKRSVRLPSRTTNEPDSRDNSSTSSAPTEGALLVGHWPPIVRMPCERASDCAKPRSGHREDYNRVSIQPNNPIGLPRFLAYVPFMEWQGRSVGRARLTGLARRLARGDASPVDF